LPALFGSSTCETFELKRACLLLVQAIAALGKNGVSRFVLAEETYEFLEGLEALLKKSAKIPLKERDMFWWDKANSLKEISGKKLFSSFKAGKKK
jgi:hypothetical protein